LFRVGFGFDVHQWVDGRECWLGGIKIESPSGPLGHSDADVLVHALCDALLGALALGDIGHHFSDKDPQWKNIDSKILLKQVCKLIDENDYIISNCDCTLILEAPKIAPHIAKMKSVLAETMGIKEGQISIKATTSEKLGYVGRGEGVCAHAVALVYPK
jgi:2-C-methyl-D-erythritol 2,4-cyclodiphosphate synthase